MARHERLLAWQKSHELTIAVYQATGKFPAGERYGLTSQARRAASSVGANIAEGAARFGPREFKRFLNIALGSLGELENHLRLALDLDLLSEGDFERLTGLANEAGKLTGLLARSLR